MTRLPGGRQVLKRLSPSRRLRVGVMVLLGGVLGAMAGGLLGADPFRLSPETLQPPSLNHLMGTDHVGRDVLTRLARGAGTSLLVASLSAGAAALIGTAVGLVAGYVGGVADIALLKVAEVAQVMPQFLVALVAAALFGSSRFLLVGILAITFWPGTARLARGEALALREREFVEAARAQGAGPLRILLRHLLPAVAPIVVVNASFQAGAAVLIEAGLAFLGLGDRNVVSWGAMLADAQTYVGIAWWMSLFPGVAVGLTVLALNLVGDGLNEVMGIRGAAPAPADRAERAPT